MLAQYSQPQPEITATARPKTAPADLTAQSRIQVLEQQITRQARRIRDLETEIQQITSHLRRSDR